MVLKECQRSVVNNNITSFVHMESRASLLWTLSLDHANYLCRYEASPIRSGTLLYHNTCLTEAEWPKIPTTKPRLLYLCEICTHLHATTLTSSQPNDEQEQDRNDMLHHIYWLVQGGRLHTVLLGDPRRVLDLGTGTGVWAVDFAE